MNNKIEDIINFRYPLSYYLGLQESTISVIANFIFISKQHYTQQIIKNYIEFKVIPI